ncbi:hypothetical protein [Gordonia neofelifaecis]|uniref:Uncharacterized protein n=1 Tax=Gordonia neofelifaecis NRRL B-59395 TaxID=644548 RepID=F1YFU5_9ACTN|nr:hypothetical protein [Gordonia neofelifaecis]EGD56522.1 hypothetical protein SCNU_03187 [Gordonia neofelifaecis NRRL B-59395]
MQSRTLPFAVVITAVTGIAVTALPWFNLHSVGLDASWNGLGMGTVDANDLGIAPSGRGWLIVAACALAGLAGLAALMPSPKARPVARVMAAVAAVGATAAAFVPIAIWIWPSWYFGDFLDGLGLSSADIGVSTAILIALIVIMLILAALCTALFIDRSEQELLDDA